MTKRLLSVSLAVALVTLMLPGIADAHVLKVDGSIGAVLHINPDDNPTAGNSTDYIMSFDDDTGRFSLPKCDCTVTIVENGHPIATKPLNASSHTVSENHYTFAKPDVYTLRFRGTPKTPGTFQPFRLNYEVRVAGGHTTTQPVPVLLWVGMGMAIGLVLLAAYAMDYDTLEQKDKGDT